MSWQLIGVMQVIGTYIASIIAHEIGHYIYFRDYCNKEIHLYLVIAQAKVMGFNLPFHLIGIKTGKPEDYNGLSNKQLYSLCAAGISAGLIPIIFMAVFFNWLLIFLFPAYIIGVQTDLKIMYSAFRGRKDEHSV